MPSMRLLNRLCAVGLMSFATLMILAASFDAPAAQADQHGQPASRASAATVADVSIVDFAFTPPVITITVGSTVRWTNTGGFTHTATSDTGVWDSGDLGPGAGFSRTFDMPGNYPYHCMHHPTMQGTIVVTADTPPSVTLTGPSDGVHDGVYAFTAIVTPITTSLPITFSWEATNQLPITHVQAALSNTIAYSWTSGMGGAQWITVTASNIGGSASHTHLIIIDPAKVYLPLVMKSVGP
jgi:plastocyanin